MYVYFSMAKIYNRNCDYCDCFYSKQNAHFCCRKCFYNSKAGSEDNIPIFDDKLHQIIEGIMFSDGCMTKRFKNAYFRFAQSSKNQEYVEYVAREFLCLNQIKKRDINLKGKIYSLVNFNTRSNDIYTKYYNRWYKDGKKIIPEDFRITPLSLYHAYIGDGGLNNSSKNSKRNRTDIRIATCSFSIEQINDIFVKQLENLGIHSKVYIQSKKYPVLRIYRKESIKKFFDFIKNNFLNCFFYKFPDGKIKEWLYKL